MSTSSILQSILDGQDQLKNDADQIKGSLKAISDNIEILNEDVKELKQDVKKNTLRLDKIGLHLANLEDDAPTIEEFDDLEKRVSMLETQTIKN